MTDLTPREIVSELDRFIIGQKRGQARRGRCPAQPLRRKQLDDDLRDEVYPKNILMIGPTALARPRSPAAWPSWPVRPSSRWKPPNSPRSAM